MVDVDAPALPLSRAQLGIWLAYQLQPTRFTYLGGYAEITGWLDAGLLAAAMKRAVAETEALKPLEPLGYGLLPADAGYKPRHDDVLEGGELWEQVIALPDIADGAVAISIKGLLVGFVDDEVSEENAACCRLV